MAIIAHIEENEPSPVALSKHSCPLCSYEWWELTDAADYPYYCPGCGAPYSPWDSEVYAEAHGQEAVKRGLDTPKLVLKPFVGIISALGITCNAPLCPACGKEVTKDNDRCPCCGQRLDWG